MKIKKIIIENFRNYQGKLEFDLSSNITILYGENGNGKSTFFDAIEWCLTDTISRFSNSERDNLKEDIINRYVNHDNVECKVIIEFENYKLVRSFHVNQGILGNTQVKIMDLNDEVKKDIKGQLTNTKERVENYLIGKTNNKVFEKNSFGKLMKQAFILSQEQVTEFIVNDDPAKRFRSMTSIMGFKSFLNFSDNLKRVLTRIKKEKESLDNNLLIITEKISSKSETKYKLDVFDLNKNLNEISIIYDGDTYKNLDFAQNELMRKKISYERLITTLKEVIKHYNSVNQIQDEVNMLKVINEENKSKLSSLDNLIDKADLKRKVYIQQQNIYLESKSLNQDIKSKEKTLLELGYFEPSVEELQNIIGKKRKEINQIQFAILKVPEFAEKRENIENIPLKINDLEKKLAILRIKKNKRNIIKNKIENLLIGDNQALLKTLINGLSDINNFISSELYEGKCPVCSTQRGEKIKTDIKNNLNSFSDNLSKHSNYADKLLELKNKLDNNVSFLEKEEKNTTLELKYSRELKQDSIEGIELIKKNEQYLSELFTLSIDDLKIRETKIKKDINKIDSAISIKLKLKELIEKESSHYKINGSDLKDAHSLSKEIKLLGRVLSRIESYYNKINKQYTLNENQYKELISYLDKLLLNFNESEWTISFKDILQKTSANIEEINSKIEKIKTLQKQINFLENNNQIQEQISTLENEKKNLENQRNKIDTIIIELESYITIAFGEFGSSAKDYLNHVSSPVQKYFRYLNPMPSNSYLQFKGDNERLWIDMCFKDDKRGLEQIYTVKNVLSSGQLNVLAIAIFLAINDAQNIHDVNFIGIDDPIQNMDDVNQYSICDVLSNINKQLIFSTHDLDFLKLFVKKNQSHISNVQIYNFTSPFLTSDKVKLIKI